MPISKKTNTIRTDIEIRENLEEFKCTAHKSLTNSDIIFYKNLNLITFTHKQQLRKVKKLQKI